MEIHDAIQDIHIDDDQTACVNFFYYGNDGPSFNEWREPKEGAKVDFCFSPWTDPDLGDPNWVYRNPFFIRNIFTLSKSNCKQGSYGPPNYPSTFGNGVTHECKSGETYIYKNSDMPPVLKHVLAEKSTDKRWSPVVDPWINTYSLPPFCKSYRYRGDDDDVTSSRMKKSKNETIQKYQVISNGRQRRQASRADAIPFYEWLEEFRFGQWYQSTGKRNFVQVTRWAQCAFEFNVTVYGK